MPVTKSVHKALRASQRKSAINKPIKSKAKSALKKARLDPNTENLQAAFSALDKAGKRNIFHKNKVSRLKSRLSKLAKTSSSPKDTKPAKKTSKSKTAKKTSSKK